MKRFFKYIFITLCAVAMGASLQSCINDEMMPCPDPGLGGELATPNPQYFIEVDIEVPTDKPASRAADSPDPLAAEKEYLVEKVALYFLKAPDATNPTADDNKVLFTLSSEVEGSSVTRDTEDTEHYKYTAKIKVDQDGFDGLANLAGKKINLFVVCNPDVFTTKNLVQDGKAEEGTFSTQETVTPIQGFGDDNKGKVLPMANAKNYILEGDDSFESIDPTNASTDDIIAGIKSLFSVQGTEMIKDLGDLDVERCVARFDIADAEADTKDNTHLAKNSWTYKVNDKYATTSGPELWIKLNSVTPVNVSGSSYVGRHIATEGTNNATSEYVFLGDKKPSDTQDYWFVEPSWTYLDADGYSRNTSGFINPIAITDNEKGVYGVTTNTYQTTIADITKAGKNTIEGYYPWHYIPENTLLGDTYWSEANRPLNATGVAFKFMVMDKSGTNALTYGSTNNPKEVSYVDAATKKIRITNAKGEYVELTPEGEGNYYYLTYYGFITHKDNENKSPMVYSVVRNTVYQLKVNSITSLPFPEEPDSYFLNLDIKILAWVKRDIEIIF